MCKKHHGNYLLLELDVFGRVGGGFVRDVILTSFWHNYKRTFDPSLSRNIGWPSTTLVQMRSSCMPVADDLFGIGKKQIC